MSEKSPDITEILPPKKYVCIPGDAVVALGPKAVVSLGTGLYSIKYSDKNQETSRAVVFSKYCAPLEKVRHHSLSDVPRYSLERPGSRRYLCSPGDPVIGIVVKKMAPHYYNLYIGGTALVYMSAMAFDGATKTSHPRLTEGSLVYGFIKQKVSNLLDSAVEGDEETSLDERGLCCADSVDVELSCAGSEVGLAPKEWTSGEAVFGPLQGGKLITVPLPYAKSLVAPLAEVTTKGKGDTSVAGGQMRKRERDVVAEADDEDVPASYLISLLGERVPFEICIGLNGMVWVKGQESSMDASAGVRRTIAVSSCIAEAQYDVTRGEMRRRVEGYFPSA